MRNLKRVLSLALALVMVLGMMVITTSAATFTDAEEITYTEAVDVMSAIGVINGVEAADGSFAFNPTETLTREQAAKIVCYLLMGETNAEKLTGSGVFTDVKATRWSAGAIDYCASLGILDGNGDGTFDPTGKLTAVQFGKMLLCALGYDADIEGYVGKNWAVNIAADMVDIGLDVYGVEMDAQLTREQAAQMALQALECDMVKYANKGTSISVNGMDIVTGASEAEARTWGTTGVGTYDYTTGGTAGLATDTIQFCEKYFAGLNKAFGEIDGREGYAWAISNKSVSEFVITDKVLATVTDGISNIQNAVNKTHKDFIVELSSASGSYALTTYLNGASVSTSQNLTVGSLALATEVASLVGNVGVIVEFIDTLPYTGKADVINVINKNVVTLTGDAATKEVKNSDTQVVVPGIINAYSAANTVKNIVGYEGLKKGDVVLTYVSDGVRYIELADKTSGKVSNTASGNKLVVNGEQLIASGLTGISLAGWTDFKNTYDFYLDNTGAVVKYVQTTEEIADAYAVPVDTSWVTGTGKIDEDNYAEAKLLFTDGSTKIVTVTKVDGKTIVAQGTSPLGANKIEFFDGSSTYAIVEDNFYTYTIDKDGNYELTTIGTQYALDTTTITTGKADFDGGAVGNNVGSTATTFIVKTVAGPKVTYTVYNGINEVPVVSSATGTVIYDRSGLASYVYVNAGSPTGSSNDFVVIVPGPGGSISYTTTPNPNGVGIAYYTVKAIVNNAEQEIKLSNLATIAGGSAAAADTLYQVSAIDANGVITGLSAAVTTTGIEIVSGTLTTTGAVYATDADTVIYYVSDEGVVTALDYTTVTADSTDEIFVVDANGDDKAELVYIMQEELNTAFASFVMYSIDGVKQSPVAPGTGITASTGEVVTITGIVVTNEGTYTIDNASFTASGTLTINLTAEDGTALSPVTVTVTFS